MNGFTTIQVLLDYDYYRVPASAGGKGWNVTSVGCIVYTAGCQTGLYNRFDNPLNEQWWLSVQHGCQTLSNRFDNRFNNRLNCVNGVLVTHGTGSIF